MLLIRHQLVQLFILSTFLFTKLYADRPCEPRRYNHTSFVCVCSRTYCDEISEIKPLKKGEYVTYSTSEEGLRFARHEGTFRKEFKRKETLGNNFLDLLKQFVKRRSAESVIKIIKDKQYQTIIGFGASFSDAVGIVYSKLSPLTQRRFMQSYFGKNGIEYNLGRVPIGGTDFSTHPYAYNEQPEDDMKLSNFSLTVEDYMYKIPVIKEARDTATDDLFLMASAWSPPIWMKTNRKYAGNSRLLKKYYQTWADYHIRFLEEYEKNNITFWSISTGNEPSNGLSEFKYSRFNSLGWLPPQMKEWLGKHFGPTIKNSKYKYLTILGLDDQRYCLPMCIAILAEDKEAFSYMDGIAVHFYWDIYFSPALVDATHKIFPDKFLINTESSSGILPWITEKVMLGSWSSAELYMKFIMQDLNHWYVGWIDWNLAVDRIGGPNWYGNYVDATIVVLPEKDEFLKQPTYYVMGHFSKFLPRGSKRVHVEQVKGDVDQVAFIRPDGGVVVIINNPFDTEKTVTIHDEDRGYISVDMPRRSFHSVVYW